MVTGRMGLGRWSLALVLAAWPVTALSQSETGSVRGTVVDADTGAPLNRARVSILEALLVTHTTAEGSFVFAQVPAGRYTLSFSKDGYNPKAEAEVAVAAGEMTELRVGLEPEVFELEEFTVRGLALGGGTELALLELRQEAPQLQDLVSAELISKAGKSTAADALKLVVGTSVQDGKYVVVRGLSDRYTVTTLNNVRLPTADADKRAVQLDQYPAGMIESIAVNKTFTPDIPGDATGGSVNIKTKGVPDKFFTTVSGAVEYNTQATGNPNFLSYKGDGVEPFAVAGSERDLPISGKELKSLTGTALDAATRSFQPVIGTSEKTVGPNYSGSFSAGDRLTLGGQHTLGWMASYSYRQKYSFYEDGERNLVFGSSEGSPLVSRSYTDTRGVDEVLWGAMATLGYQYGEDHKISLTGIYNKTGRDEARLLVSTYNPYFTEYSEVLRYQEREVISLQLEGDHRFRFLNDTRFDWGGAYNESTQEEPDFRVIRTQKNNATGRFTIGGANFDDPRRIFRVIEEDNLTGRMNLSIPFPTWNRTDGKIKLGVASDVTHRDYRQDTFFYTWGGATSITNGSYLFYPSPYENINPGDLWSDVFLRSYRIGYAANGERLWLLTYYNDVDVNYTGDQRIEAAYGMMELPLFDKLKIVGGARVESTDLQVNILEDRVSIPVVNEWGDSYFIYITGEEASTRLEQTDVLPALGVIWEPITNLFVRAFYGRTLARPTFRELSPAVSYDFIGGDTFIGNNNLTISQIENLDFRIEWFRRPGDVIAAGVFYKEITDPIERVAFNISGGDRYVRAVNYPLGRVRGVEAELRQRLDLFHDVLKDFSIGFNASYIESAVELPADEARRLSNALTEIEDRPLFGQPEYLLNASILYDNTRWGTSVGLFYNYTGKVLVSGQSFTDRYVPNLYEMPVESLDLSVDQRIGKHWKISFRVKNLTNPLIQRAYIVSWLDEPTLESSYRRGLDYQLGATYSW